SQLWRRIQPDSLRQHHLAEVSFNGESDALALQKTARAQPKSPARHKTAVPLSALSRQRPLASIAEPPHSQPPSLPNQPDPQVSSAFLDGRVFSSLFFPLLLFVCTLLPGRSLSPQGGSPMLDPPVASLPAPAVPQPPRFLDQ